MTLSFRAIRITILLIILFFVAMDTWLGMLRTTDWDQPLWVVIYPMNGDNSTSSQKRIERLTPADFEEINTFLKRETGRYEVNISQPLHIELASQVHERPPPTPDQTASRLDIALWSLKMRWWVWQVDNYSGPTPDIRIFVEYYDHADSNGNGHNSFGLQKGRYGLARLYAASHYQSRNNIIIAHELLHILGASDKYDFITLQPHYPDGFANPDQDPRYPQTRAEIMAGRIALGPTQVRMPRSLEQSIIGTKTAEEIGFTSN